MPLPWGERLGLDACHRLGLGLGERAHACKTSRRETPPPLGRVEGLWRKLAVPTGDITRDAVGRKHPGKHQEKRGMLTALGLWADGHGAMLTWQRAPGEDAGPGGRGAGPCTPTGARQRRHHCS